MDYDRNIHHNPDAMAWAKFFVETTKDMGREVFCDEDYMVGWFANAMMAMHDSMKPHESADEIERLREDLDLIKKMARAEIDAKLRYAAALRNIADIEHEDLAAPKSPAEAVLWVCLDRCVTLAESALKWKE